MTDSAASSIWRKPQFQAYLGGTAFAGMGLAMQQLLLNWMLIGILLLPADEVGQIQALIGIPGVFLMLMGGARADRVDPRNFLIGVYLIAPIFPLFLVTMESLGHFAVWSIIIWGLGISFVQSYSTPAQQAILNRISGAQVQQGVTGASIAGLLIQVAALALAGQMDRIGIAPVLWAQGISIGLAAWAMTRINRIEPIVTAGQQGTVQGIVEGLRATYRSKVIFQILLINFSSSIFNFGSFATVFPFVVKRIYDGDAFTLSALMMVFFFGGTVANTILLRFVPLKRPGRLFLLMQLSRIVVLFLIYIRGEFWLMIVATFGWGLTMGVTSNLARSIVQESAQAEYRGRIMSVFSVGLVGSAPLGAVLLGWLIETVGTLNALWPAMLASGLLFLYGVFFSGVWKYVSAPQADP